MTTRQAVFLGGNGIASGLAMMLFFYGVSVIGSTTTSFINMLELVTNLVVDMIFYHAFPNTVGWMGFLFILLSVFFVALPAKQSSEEG